MTYSRTAAHIYDKIALNMKRVFTFLSKKIHN